MTLKLKIPALDQLLSITASGIGSVAGPMLAPWRARRYAEAKRITAEADADVLRIQADAQSKARDALVPSGARAVSELDIRTAIQQRIRFQEEKRQANIMSVVAEAASQLGDVEVDRSEPDHDWTARFFDGVQDVSSKEMQSLWARVLAGEVVRKGSVSVRTLHVLRNLDQETARYFGHLCSCCFYISTRQDIVEAQALTCGSNIGPRGLAHLDMDFITLNRLSEYGLTIPSVVSSFCYHHTHTEDKPRATPFEFQDAQWVLVPIEGFTPTWNGHLMGVLLSSSGKDLAAVVNLEPVPEFENAIRGYLGSRGIMMTQRTGSDE